MDLRLLTILAVFTMGCADSVYRSKSLSDDDFGDDFDAPEDTGESTENPSPDDAGTGGDDGAEDTGSPMDGDLDGGTADTAEDSGIDTAEDTADTDTADTDTADTSDDTDTADTSDDTDTADTSDDTASDADTSDDTDTADTSDDTASDADTDIAAEADTGTVDDTDIDTDTAEETEPDTDADEDTDAGEDTDADEDIDADEDTGEDTGEDTEADEDTGEDTEADEDTGEDTEADEDTGEDASSTMDMVDYCHIQDPCTIETSAGGATGAIYTLIYETGVTDSIGEGLGIEVELGIGPEGSTPDDSWSWQEAFYNGDLEGLEGAAHANDEYQRELTAPTTPGNYNYAARTRIDDGPWLLCDLADECIVGGVGSRDGYAASTAGVLTVTADAEEETDDTAVSVDTGSASDGEPAASDGETTGDTIDWCHIQFPCDTTAPAGGSMEPVYTWVYEYGVTDALGKGEGVEVQLGIGADGSWPDESWAWTDALYNTDKVGLIEGVLDNDEYICTPTAPTEPGTYDYAARARIGSGEWLLCDGGYECGGEGSEDEYSPDEAGHLLVETDTTSGS